MTQASPPVPASGGWAPVGEPLPMPPPLPVPTPQAVVWATVLCSIGVAVVAWGLLLSTGYVLAPDDGVTRREAAVATAGLVGALALFLVAGHGLRKRRPWGWWACIAMAACGVVLGGYGTRYFVAAAVEVVAGRSRPAARGWFSTRASAPVPAA